MTRAQSASTSRPGVILIFCRISCRPWREPFLTTPQIPEPAHSLPYVLYPVSCIYILYIYILYPTYTSSPISHIYMSVCVYIYPIYPIGTNVFERRSWHIPSSQTAVNGLHLIRARSLEGCSLRENFRAKEPVHFAPWANRKAMELQMLLLLL